MGVHHPFGLTGGAAGVTQTHGRMFVQVRPGEFDRLVLDENFIILGYGKAGFTPFAMTTNDDLLNRWHLIEQGFEQRQKVFVRKDHAIARVIDNVF